MEFVEAEEPRLLADLVGDVADRVAIRNGAELQLMPHLADAVVHVGHEFVEMRPPLPPHFARREEQIHQHGLAAADVAVDVEALHRAGRLAAREQPAERGRLARQPVLRQRLLQRRQPADELGLGGVGLDLAGGDERGVTGGEGVGHVPGGGSRAFEPAGGIDDSYVDPGPE